jgi:acetyl esterase/lipase
MTTTRDYLDVVPAAGLRIRYGADPNQFGELRLPAGPGPHPIVMVVHGGWWLAGYGLTYAGHMGEALTADGFATWNIEYRRIGQPGGGYPGTFEDVTAALCALRALAPEYHLDLGRIIVTGHSAGGHIAAWLASKHAHRSLDAFGDAPASAGAVPVAGVLDLERTSALALERDGEVPVHQLLGGTAADVPAAYALASPTRLLPTGIPVIAVHGDADDAVPLELSQRYVERAQAAGDPARLIVLPDVDHFEIFDPGAPAGAVVRDAIRQLHRTCSDSSDHDDGAISEGTARGSIRSPG